MESKVMVYSKTRARARALCAWLRMCMQGKSHVGQWRTKKCDSVACVAETPQ